MNREILFKAKRKDNGDWVEGFLYQAVTCSGNIGFCHIITRAYESCTGLEIIQSFEVDPETVCQYTGITDKNGVRIFEGHIFKTHLGCNAVVEWEKEGRFLGFTIERERKIVYVNREPKVEVIGNRWDNSELLEVQSV